MFHNFCVKHVYSIVHGRSLNLINFSFEAIQTYAVGLAENIVTVFASRKPSKCINFKQKNNCNSKCT